LSVKVVSSSPAQNSRLAVAKAWLTVEGRRRDTNPRYVLGGGLLAGTLTVVYGATGRPRVRGTQRAPTASGSPGTGG